MPAPVITCCLVAAVVLALGGQWVAGLVIAAVAAIVEFLLPSSLSEDDAAQF